MFTFTFEENGNQRVWTCHFDAKIMSFFSSYFNSFKVCHVSSGPLVRLMLGTSAHLLPVGRSLSLQEKTKSTRLLSTPMEQFCTQLLATLSECGTLESKNQILISQQVVLMCGKIRLSVNSRRTLLKLLVCSLLYFYI